MFSEDLQPHGTQYAVLMRRSIGSLIMSMDQDRPEGQYIGRLAPSPTGRLHIGHAATFRRAYERARSHGGRLWLRIEDLDPSRCREEWIAGILEDLSWLGLDWDPYPGDSRTWLRQSTELSIYQTFMEKLIRLGVPYPCKVSRSEIRNHPDARQNGEGEWLFPSVLRTQQVEQVSLHDRAGWAWRFRTQENRCVTFNDLSQGSCAFRAGEDFGDFVLWTVEGFPSYELAVVVDDHLHGVTEVVRGQDLLLSTARQLLLYEAFGWEPPAFFHCPLVRDSNGVRLAKRFDSESVESHRERGLNREEFWNYVSSRVTEHS
jgi:glutamyl/glutaminyl-tRNA synthetase